VRLAALRRQFRLVTLGPLCSPGVLRFTARLPSVCWLPVLKGKHLLQTPTLGLAAMGRQRTPNALLPRPSHRTISHAHLAPVQTRGLSISRPSRFSQSRTPRGPPNISATAQCCLIGSSAVFCKQGALCTVCGWVLCYASGFLGRVCCNLLSPMYRILASHNNSIHGRPTLCGLAALARQFRRVMLGPLCGRHGAPHDRSIAFVFLLLSEGRKLDSAGQAPLHTMGRLRTPNALLRHPTHRAIPNALPAPG